MPLFMPPEDRAREALLGAHLGTLWGWEMHQQPELDMVDWVAEDPAKRCAVAVVEVKGRKVAFTAHRTVWVSCAKVDALARLAHGHGLDWRTAARFVVEWNDGKLGWILAARAACYPAPLVGNHTRGPHRVEPCHHVPVDQFTLLPEFKCDLSTPNRPLR
jgi:hypothetical protein